MRFFYVSMLSSLRKKDRNPIRFRSLLFVLGLEQLVQNLVVIDTGID